MAETQSKEIAETQSTEMDIDGGLPKPQVHLSRFGSSMLLRKNMFSASCSNSKFDDRLIFRRVINKNIIFRLQKVGPPNANPISAACQILAAQVA
jgi:hypothetical protein